MGLERGIAELTRAGCKQIFLDGSYVTAKPEPQDYDLCWDPTDVDPKLLDPILWHPNFLKHPRTEQQQNYFGDYFQSSIFNGNSAQTFLDFFQIDKHSGQPKGIINIRLVS